MNKIFDPAEVVDWLTLPDGNSIVLVDRLGKGGVYAHEELARNVYLVDAKGNVRWQVRTDFDAQGGPFTRLHRNGDTITAYRWDGGTYSLDIKTGVAQPLLLER